MFPILPFFQAYFIKYLWKLKTGKRCATQANINDGVIEGNAARVTAMSLKNNTTTLATEYARQGKNWKTELAQIKKEREVLESMGLG